MKTYLIIYSTDEDTRKIVSRIKTFNNWIRVKNRVWCISTETESSKDVRDKFDTILKPTDLLLVIDISKSSWAAVNLPENVVYWLKER